MAEIYIAFVDTPGFFARMNPKEAETEIYPCSGVTRRLLDGSI